MSVPDEESLRALARRVSLAGFAHVLIEEVDYLYDGELTAIGFVPVPKYGRLKDFLKDLPLLM